MKRKERTLDSVTTINEDGSRYFIHPSDVQGVYTSWRRFFALALIGVYIALPWIPIDGHPAVFLDVVNRKFHLFGITLLAQDIWLTFFLISGLGFSLFFVTALFGRIWCGWACPQTVFLEFVFRRVERWIEGDAPMRRALDSRDWDGGKTFKRILKHGIFLICALLIAHIFISYFVSLPALYEMMQHSPGENWGVFVVVFFLAGALYFNFAWFREQFCIVLCPYGRFQSALIDKDSVVIGYDENRGEPRGKAKDPGVGDCIDCRRCVQVCPTGIDIRQGLQMECIGCSNCIDACDEIMTKLDRPKGLVRYSSMSNFSGKKTQWIRPRIILYAFLLCVGFGVMSYAVSTVKPVNFSVVRLTGAPFIESKGIIRNQFLVRVTNKKHQPIRFQVVVDNPKEGLQMSGFPDLVKLEAEEEVKSPLILTLPKTNFDETFPIILKVEVEGEEYEIKKKVSFLGPEIRGRKK